MQDYFGWKNPNMANEYISTTKRSVKQMAERMLPTDSGNSDPNNGKELCLTSKDDQIQQEPQDPDQLRLIQNNNKVVYIQNFNGTLSLWTMLYVWQFFLVFFISLWIIGKILYIFKILNHFMKASEEFLI